jgi:hypothetical protein
VSQSSVIQRWAGVPTSARLVGAVVVVALVYGTAVHVIQLVTAGASAYPDVPAWLATYFVSLVVLDPVAAALLAIRSRAGLLLASVVLVTDALANGYANFVLSTDPGVTIGRVAVAIVGVLAISLIAAMPRLWPARR